MRLISSPIRPTNPYKKKAARRLYYGSLEILELVKSGEEEKNSAALHIQIFPDDLQDLSFEILVGIVLEPHALMTFCQTFDLIYNKAADILSNVLIRELWSCSSSPQVGMRSRSYQ